MNSTTGDSNPPPHDTDATQPAEPRDPITKFRVPLLVFLAFMSVVVGWGIYNAMNEELPMELIVGGVFIGMFWKMGWQRQVIRFLLMFGLPTLILLFSFQGLPLFLAKQEVEQIKEPQRLEEIVRENKKLKLRVYAVERLTDVSSLERLAHDKQMPPEVRDAASKHLREIQNR